MKTADPEFMRAINRFHVMDAIRRFGPISRVEIAERTDLSPTTVSAITAALLDDGLIIPRPVGALRDATRGRPRVMLELNPDAAFVVGAKLAPDQITVAVTNFRADVLQSLSLPIRIDRQPVSVIADLVEDGVRRCVADAGLTMAAVSGVCVGLPGIVERASGRCRQSPIFREADVPLGAKLSQRLGMAVTVDNDANLVTLAEHWFGHGRGLDDFLVVSIAGNLGLGIMHKGELFRGAGGLSPDLGDFLVRPPNGHNTPTRLEAIVSEASHAIRSGADDAEIEFGLSHDRRRARLRHRQPHHPFRPAQGDPRRGDGLGRRALARPAARRRRALHAAEPCRHLRDRRPRLGRHDLGARCRRHDPARPLWRALEHDRPGAAATQRLKNSEGEDVEPIGIGIIGCGNISGAYLKAARFFPILDIRAVADLNADVAAARGAEFGIPAKSVEDLLADPAIQIVVNLTVPGAHVEVGLKALAAGKHVHSEKPLGIAVDEARKLVEAGKARNLRIGCAPDTFLGGAHQTCRKLIDDGAIGQPIAGTAFFGTAGHERWHPNPGFYYLRGGGPMLDMGPYYITALVNLLGPVKRVAGMTSRLRAERLVTSQPLNGTKIPVEVATHVTGTMEFVSGAIITIAMSFDVARHDHRPIEIYGSEAAMSVPDPNHFGGQIEMANAAATNWRGAVTEHPYANGNFRIIGVADMAHAIRNDRPHRASGDLAFHVLEVMEAFQRSSDAGTHITIDSRPERPAMLPTDLTPGMLD